MNLSQAIDIIQSGEIFSCKVVSLDEKRKTGGKIREYKEAVICRNELKPKKPKRNPKMESGDVYTPESYERKIFLVAEGKPTSVIHTIHLPLLLEVNGQKVML